MTDQHVVIEAQSIQDNLDNFNCTFSQFLEENDLRSLFLQPGSTVYIPTDHSEQHRVFTPTASIASDQPSNDPRPDPQVARISYFGSWKVEYTPVETMYADKSRNPEFDHHDENIKKLVARATEGTFICLEPGCYSAITTLQGIYYHGKCHRLQSNS